MKWSFRTTKTLFACLMVGYLLPSCNPQKSDTDLKLLAEQKDTIKLLREIAANLTLCIMQDAPPHLRGNQINVGTYDTVSGKLALVDQTGSTRVDSVSVDRKQTITWHVNNGVIQIDEIGLKKKSNDDTMFCNINPPAKPNQDWSVTVRDLNENLSSYTHYYIKWHKTSSPNKSHTYDPLMQLNPVSKLVP
jgi:hypothetical protein